MKPSFSVLNVCRKDELLQIASRFELTFPKTILKKDLKALIVDKMAELGHTLFSAQIDPAELDGAAAGKSESLGSGAPPSGASADDQEAKEESRRQKTPFTLPRFDPLSESSIDPRRGTQLKVRFARLQLEADEKAQERQAQLQLDIRKLEIEADTAVRLRQLELESQKQSPAPPEPTTSGMPHLTTASTQYPFDVTKQLALVPPFRENEVDSYFGALNA